VLLAGEREGGIAGQELLQAEHEHGHDEERGHEGDEPLGDEAPEGHARRRARVNRIDTPG